jgi:hypothetical protein
MLQNHLRTYAAGLLVAFALAGPNLVADARGSKHDAELLRQKVAGITAFAANPTATPRRTTVTEQEVNAFLAYDSALPVGVLDPSISILGDGRLTGRAVVDLDAVRRQNASGGSLDPMSYLTGRLPVTIDGVLRTNDGIGRFTLESATVAGVPVPKPVLQQIVSHYSRSPDLPDGVDIDAPFSLPARIREIQVGHGQAVIVQ